MSCEARSLFGIQDSDIEQLFASELVDAQSREQWTASLEHVASSTDDGVSTVKLPSLLAHMRRLPAGDVLAQFTSTGDNNLADRILDEQKQFRVALLELGELAHTTKDDDDFYQRLLERTVEVVPGAQGGSIQLAIPDTTTFRFVAAVGYDLAGLQQRVLDRQDFFRDTLSPKAQIVTDLTVDARTPEVREWLETIGRLSEIQSNVSAPVLVDGLPVAFLSVDNFVAPDGMNETSVEMVTVLARLIGDLYVRRQLEFEIRREREAFRHLALHDPVTGLANRRQFEQSLEGALAAAGRRSRPSAVVFIDLDDFKGVNDSFGHDFGDRVLGATALALQDTVRGSDIVARWGGDEFVILPGRIESVEQVTELGARILARFADPLDLGDGVSHLVTMSVGISWSTDSRVGPEQLVRTADEALYEAKADGKATVRFRKV